MKKITSNNIQQEARLSTTMAQSHLGTIDYTRKMRLLFVEDDAISRELLESVFQEFFDDITAAADGAEGLEKFLAEENRFDLIVTDVNMPKMNGLEMIEKIREKDQHIPILIMSAYSESHFLLKAIEYNINGYITKPVNFRQIEQELHKITNNFRLEQEAKESHYLLTQYQEIVDANSIVSKTDTRGIITYVNQNFCDISEYTQEELLGKPHNIVRHPDTPKEVFQELWHTISVKKSIWSGIIKNKAKSGKSYYVKTTVKPILDNNGNIIEYIALRENVTAMMNPKKQLKDELASHQNPLLLYFKLRDFSIVEELFDSTTIEKMEEKLSLLISEKLPKKCQGSKVFQLGYGAFGVVTNSEICSPESEEFQTILKHFQKEIEKEIIDLDNYSYDVALNISVSYGNENLLKNAKLGIKTLEKNQEHFIIANNLVEIENQKIQHNMQTLLMIQTAINEKKIISYFQEIVDNKTQKPVKYESLVRLIDTNGKIISPYFFLETAKKGKYYAQITQIVLENSFDALTKTDKEISINLSAIDIELELVRNKIFTLLELHREHAHRVVFELLEDESIQNFELIHSFIHKVKEYGVQIAIDDFGAGYSNFERLLQYQPDILKIDGSLIKNIENDPYSLSIVKTIVNFAKDQNLQLVAEFVENETIYNILTKLNIEYSQGYYFAQPKPLNEI